MKTHGRPLVLCFLLVCSAFLVSCTKDVSRIRVGRIDRTNPTAFVFDAPPAETRDRIAEALRASNAPDAVFGERERADDDTQYADYFVVEDARDPVFGRDVLYRPGNGRDVYVHTFGEPLWASPVYRGSRGGLPFVASFHVHLVPEGTDRTRVSVRVVDPQIRNGMAWGIGSCGPGYAWRYQRVAPTTVEEYALLRYIGRTLGARRMPEIVLPG